ncbi:MAG: hypothetical protein BWY15_02439 [Firmicutes bacterium ADurb.Bin193]|nr:MAG: hypothetical protein BWY15_02439 [Firmicutes bacterium ADurb.Bin193]
MEQGLNVALRIDVTQGEYDLWSDTIFVEYTRKSAEESRILENDIVTIYGTMNGLKTYQSVLGNQVTVPCIVAEYIELP